MKLSVERLQEIAAMQDYIIMIANEPVNLAPIFREILNGRQTISTLRRALGANTVVLCNLPASVRGDEIHSRVQKNSAILAALPRDT